MRLDDDKAPISMRTLRQHLSGVRLDARPARRERPRRPKRVPRNSYRRVNSPQPPHAVELFFAQAVKVVVRRMMAAAIAVVKPRIKDFAKPESEDKKDAHFDADSKSAKALAKQMKAAADRRFNVGGFNVFADKAVKQANQHSEKEFRRLGIDVRTEPKMDNAIKEWRKQNVARIESLADREISKVEKILESGFGRRAESIAKDIAYHLEDVTDSQAELIARDQVLTLNAQITAARQQAAGIEGYIWTTSNDERVREEHAELEGQRFSWDDPPEVGHPGEDINCRCTAFPILPELEDEEPKDSGEEG